MIRLEEVRKVHGAGPAATLALDAITLSVGAGEFVAVAGPSGSGKTTLLNVVGGLDRPSAGSVALDGRDLASLGDEALADLRLERLGFVFQGFHLVPVLTALENVELPLLFRRGLGRAERRRWAAAALERVGLAASAGRRPAALSAGERQRVAVARALAGSPALVLADEPTASLDHAAGRAVIGLMRQANRERGATFLYATHDPELIALADRIVTLRDGHLIGEGP